MLRTRLWMGAILIALAVGVLVGDQRFAPYFPFLFVFTILLSVAGCVELVNLLPADGRPNRLLCLLSVVALTLANWPSHIFPAFSIDPWHWIAGVFGAIALAALLLEMATFLEPGQSVKRISQTLFCAAYLGFLPCFLTQMRWLPGLDAGETSLRGVGALAMAIFVPKVCDIGAYFTGRLLGKHKMTPILSPKKTWEGFAGGMLAATACAFGINRGIPTLRHGDLAAVGFGVTVGLAGILGDLAESLIKRDCKQKDASQIMPGFGGVLDVVDSVVFAAPVAYLWMLL